MPQITYMPSKTKPFLHVRMAVHRFNRAISAVSFGIFDGLLARFSSGQLLLSVEHSVYRAWRWDFPSQPFLVCTFSYFFFSFFVGKWGNASCTLTLEASCVGLRPVGLFALWIPSLAILPTNTPYAGEPSHIP